MSDTKTPPPLPPLPGQPVDGPGSPRDVPPLPGTSTLDPAQMPDAIRAELEAPDPSTIDTGAAELRSGLNRCPKCGSSDIRPRLGTDLLVCQFCR